MLADVGGGVRLNFSVLKESSVKVSKGFRCLDLVLISLPSTALPKRSASSIRL